MLHALILPSTPRHRPRTPPESPFRLFNVKCLKCGSYHLCLASDFDDEAGELRLTLTCSRCRQCEMLKVR